MRGEVSIYIQASPGRVYALVSDVTRMGEWSPETYSCAWLDGATEATVGARFKGHNRRGLLRWSNTPEVIAADRGREFAFRRVVFGNEVHWRYRMLPEGSGTRLSESYEVLTPSPAWMNCIVTRLMGVQDREADLLEGMRTTLQRLRQTAERDQLEGGGAPGPGALASRPPG
jgi:Polyketide cyclase / dehydrase and lipid transport